MISKKLQAELARIADADPERMQQKHIMWITAAQQRQNFINKLNEDIANQEFVSPKHKSRFYSNSVAQYDRECQQVFYV